MTLTYYELPLTNSATGIHIADREKAFGTSPPGSTNTDTSLSIAVGGAQLTHIWTTASGQPNMADWGSGTYRCVMNVTAIGANVSYGLMTTGAAAGHFARVDSGLTSDLETVTQAESLFTGAGIKTATASWDPAAGSTSDRFECALAASNAGSMTQTISITSSTTGDSFADGPFDVAAPTGPPPPFPYRRIEQRSI